MLQTNQKLCPFVEKMADEVKLHVEDEEKGEERRLPANMSTRMSSCRFNLEGKEEEKTELEILLHCPPPEGVVNLAQGETFSFQTEIQEIEAEEASEEVSGITPQEQFGDLFENPIPRFPKDFDLQAFSARRDGLAAIDYIPSRFTLRPMRTVEQFGEHEKLLQVNLMNSVHPQIITFIWLEDLAQFLSPKQRKAFVDALASFQNVEVLGLRNAGLKRVDNLHLPLANYVDLSQNLIDNVNSVVSMVSGCPSIQVLLLNNNPISSQRAWSDAHPEPASEAWKIMCHLPLLKVLNGQSLSLEQHINAVFKFGNAQQKQLLPLRSWDEVFCGCVEEITTMYQWEPYKIINLNLSNSSILSFHVGPLVALQTLNLAGNRIQSVLGSGIERCEALHTADLSNNAISNINELQAFSFVIGLRHLALKGNPCDYKLRVIFETRHLPGYHTHGLQTLDGEKITVEERVQV